MNKRKTLMLTKTLLPVMLLIFSNVLLAQDSTTTNSTPEIDPSKPTNLYTQVNIGFEFQSSKTEKKYGPRVNVQYAVNQNNLFLLELPLQYNDQTRRFGLSDTRVRYFSILKRNISKKFIALGTLVDVTIPTGSYGNGLGSSSWSFAAGTIFGLLISPKISLFPGLSYVHVTKPTTNKIPEALKASADGIALQFNCSYRFNKTTFLFVNPLPTFLNVKGSWTTNWAGELNLNKILVPNKFKMNVGWSPNFTNEVYGYKLGATFYL
jgi:hypothetical protein